MPRSARKPVFSGVRCAARHFALGQFLFEFGDLLAKQIAVEAKRDAEKVALALG